MPDEEELARKEIVLEGCEDPRLYCISILDWGTIQLDRNCLGRLAIFP